jgi:hypothetical protein
MKRKLKLTITKIRRPANNLRIFCPACGIETEMLTAGECAGFLKIENREFDDLINTRKIHAFETVTGSLRVCKNSLFRRS